MEEKNPKSNGSDKDDLIIRLEDELLLNLRLYILNFKFLSDAKTVRLLSNGTAIVKTNKGIVETKLDDDLQKALIRNQIVSCVFNIDKLEMDFRFKYGFCRKYSYKKNRYIEE